MLLVDIVFGLKIFHIVSESGIMDQKAESRELRGHCSWQTLPAVNVCFCIRVN